VQRFQSMKHFDLKHKLQLFPSPFELLFSYFEASVKQYCLRPLQKQTKGKSRRRHRHYTETHTCLSELSASIWIILIRGSVRSTRGLGPTMTARGQSIGISVGMLPQTLTMSITVQKTSKYYTTEFDLEEGFLNGDVSAFPIYRRV